MNINVYQKNVHKDAKKNIDNTQLKPIRLEPETKEDQNQPVAAKLEAEKQRLQMSQCPPNESEAAKLSTTQQ